MSIETKIDTIASEFSTVYDHMNDDSYAWNTSNYPNVIEDANIVQTELTGYTELSKLMNDRSSDALLWADQINNYVCNAVECFDRLVDSYIFAKSMMGYNVSEKILDKVILKLKNIQLLLLLSEKPIDYIDQVDFLYSEIVDIKNSIVSLNDIITESLYIISLLKDGLKIMTAVGISLSLSEKAINIKNKISQSSDHIINAPETTNTVIELENNEQFTTHVDFPQNKKFKEFVENDDIFYNNIIYTCLSNGVFKESDNSYYKMIDSKIDKKEFNTIKTDWIKLDNSTLSTEEYINSIDESSSTTEDIKNIENIINIYAILDCYVFDSEEDTQKLKDKIREYGIPNTLTNEDAILETIDSFYNTLFDLKNMLTIDNIKYLLQLENQKQDSIAVQYILKNIFRKQSGVFRINTDFSYLDAPIDLKYDIINTNSLSSSFDTQCQDLLINLYNYLISSNDYKDMFNTTINNLNNIFSNMIKYKWVEDEGKKTIGYFKQDSLVSQYGSIFYKYKAFKNLNTVLYGEFSIINKNVQYDCVIYKNNVYSNINYDYNNYSEDNLDLILTKVDGNLHVSNNNIYDGNIPYSFNKSGYKLLNYNIHEDIKSLNTLIGEGHIIDNNLTGSTSNNIKTITKQSSDSLIVLNYSFENNADRYGTTSAMHYREQIRAGAITYGDATTRAIIRGLKLLNLNQEFQHFIDNTNENGIQIEDYSSVISIL